MYCLHRCRRQVQVVSQRCRPACVHAWGRDECGPNLWSNAFQSAVSLHIQRLFNQINEFSSYSLKTIII